jgi:hypothetical protein
MSVCAFFTVFIILLVGAFIAILLTWRHDPSYQLTLNALTQNNANLQKQLLEQTVLMNEKLLSNIANKPAETNKDNKDEFQKFKDELKAEMDAKIKSACWMDSGEPVKLTQEGSRISFYAQPFAYGTHGVVRVAKLETE